MKRIAIFDIDGTIFRSSLTIELYHQLVLDGIFSQKSWEAIERKHTKWLNREGGYEHYMWEVVKWYHKEIKGVHRPDLIKACKKMLQNQKKRTYRYTINLIDKLRKRYLLIGVSGSQLEVVEEYNKFLKFDKLYGTEIGLDEKNRYTGKVIHSPWDYKKELVTRYVRKHGLSLKGSIGVGDTEADIGFLEVVEQPIAFNPNIKLAERAKKDNWKIVLERKDLIMEINSKNNKVNFLNI